MAVLNFPSDPSTQTPVNTYSPDSTPLASDNGVTYVWDGEKWTATTSSNFLPLSGGTLTGDLTVPNLISEGDVRFTSLNGGPLAGLRNQLINGDFRIWQRGTNVTGQISASTGTYLSTDRWAFFTAGGIQNIEELLAMVTLLQKHLLLIQCSLIVLRFPWKQQDLFKALS